MNKLHMRRFINLNRLVPRLERIVQIVAAVNADCIVCPYTYIMREFAQENMVQIYVFEEHETPTRLDLLTCSTDLGSEVEPLI